MHYQVPPPLAGGGTELLQKIVFFHVSVSLWFILSYQFKKEERLNRLQRLYIREFGVLLLIVASMLSAVFSVIFIVDRMDELIPYSQTTETLILLGALKIPEYLRYLLPMASLLCSIFVISSASRRHEIIAIKASGVNLRRFFMPFIIAGILLVTIDFVIAEFIAPASLKKSNDIIYSLKGEKKISYQEGNIWIRARKGLLVRAKLFVPQKMELYGISIFYIHDGRLTKRIEAEKGVWSGQDWRLQEVREFDLNRNTVRYMPEKLLKGVGKTEIIEREKNRLSEMSVMELIRHEKRLENAGYMNTKLKVDIQSRLSYPLANLFMVMIGIFLSLKSRKGKGMVSAGAGILISLAYWVIYTLSLSLGYAGGLPPVVSAWIVPVVFLALGGVLYFRIPV
ncbi:MAG TPA: YjgP/YjgQ family permease [Nitrospirae bacterium]|nr:YjgP/YjgQ family permease [Nitrospirota bacterium]